MQIGTENSADTQERGRILFTGNAGRVIDDLMKRVPEQHQLEKCPPSEQDFVQKLNGFNPHVVVACLSDESAETTRIFALLDGSTELVEMPVIAIGNDEDCEFFAKRVSRKNMRIFERPLNRDQFFETLEKYLRIQIQTVRELASEKPESSAATGENANAPAPQVAAQTEAGVPSPQPEAAQAVTAAVESAPGIRKELSSLGSARATILVVDDDVRMLNMAKLCLQDLYDVVVVPSGKLALKYLSKKTADLVLLDYMMPEEDGPMVLQQIRQSSSQPDIPVLFLTGVSDRDMVLRGLEFHPKGYLLKPVTRELLIAKVTEILLGI